MVDVVKYSNLNSGPKFPSFSTASGKWHYWNAIGWIRRISPGYFLLMLCTIHFQSPASVGYQVSPVGLFIFLIEGQSLRWVGSSLRLEVIFLASASCKDWNCNERLQSAHWGYPPPAASGLTDQPMSALSGNEGAILTPPYRVTPNGFLQIRNKYFEMIQLNRIHILA